MTHRSNGKHRYPASEPTSRFKAADVPDRPVRSDFETTLTDTHDAIVETATRFIRERPAASLLLAAALGGLVGWLVKRRG